MTEEKKIKFTINQFHAKYPDDDACLHEIFLNRFGNLKSCPKCTKPANFHKILGRKVYSCSHCGHHLSPLADTIFHKSSTSLKDWFYAIFLFSASKNGVSAKELERQLGVTYKTAWRMAKQIRKLFDEDSNPFDGTVEVDETYVGGKARGKRGRGSDKKTPVVGLVEREGSVKAVVTKNVKSSIVMPLIKDNVKQGSVVMTDEYNIYNSVPKAGYEHHTVNHGAKQYVEGINHTNTIEGFWSQLKRSVDGTYHAVSPKYLQTYVNEFSYRYNRRNDKEPIFNGVIQQVAKLA